MQSASNRSRGRQVTPAREKSTPRSGGRNAVAESPATTPGGSGSPSSPSTAGATPLSRAMAPIATTAMSGNTARYAATCAADMHSWILAIKQPTSPALPASSSDFAGNAEPADERRRSSRHSRPASAMPGDLRRHSSGSQVTQLPLEERIGLAELQQIMRAFELPSSNGGGDDSAPSSSRNSSRRGAPHARGEGGRIGSFLPLSETLRSVDELSAIAAPLPRRAHSPRPASSKGEAQEGGAPRRPPGRVRFTPPPALAGLASDPTTQPLRQLSQDEFVRVLQGVVPSATLPEIQALLTKAVSETQDTVSWNDLATFLVTRSRQKADLALENQRFVLSGQPVGMRFDDQHGDAITCIAVEPVRRLLVTGCSGGAVRAWSSGSDLAYRGLLLQVDKWIVGLHWGCDNRVLYVVTMDRWVYVLDGTTYEVLRVFHGRGIADSARGMTYASETIGTVRVGGVPLTKRAVAGARHANAAHVTAQAAAMPDKARAATPPRRTGTRASGRTDAAAESRDDRMNRLLSSAMQVRRAVRPVETDRSIAAMSHRSSSAQADSVSAVLASGGGTGSGTTGEAQLSTSLTSTAAPSVSRRPSYAVATVYSLTTGAAAEALHQDNTPLTGAGRGPYVAQRVEEGVLTALVDPVTATEFHESVFQEDVLLLGTSGGDVFLFQLAEQHHPPARRVLAARHVFRQLHRSRITKLELLLPLDALVSSGDDGYVRVTSLVTGNPLRHFYASDLPEQHASISDFALNAELKMLMTIGPERRALVWEWTQPSPIAVLDPANSPCCCGAFMGDRLLMTSRDGMLHVYDCKGFRLQQELPLASTAALDRFGTSVGASRTLISILHVDETRQRVLGFGRFPFSLGAKRQVSTGCPERYRGHHAPMLTTLASRPFGQVVTVGTDGVVMTWTPRTGANEFSFLLSNFSNTSTTSAPLRPTVAAMDVLQRRLLTGFDGGTMVVWNILSGQVERVLTAAPSAPSGASAGAAVPAIRPALSPSSMAGRSGLASPSPTTPTAKATATAAAAAAAASTAKRDVTAVGSLLRHRVVSYIFAIGPRLYVDAAVERNGAGVTAATAAAQRGGSGLLGEYSTAPASSWVVPPSFGDVVKLVQLGPQIVGCGTSSGAVLLYNVQSDRQEGAPMWVREAMLTPAWAGTSNSSASNGVLSANSIALLGSPGENAIAGGPRHCSVSLVGGAMGATSGALVSAAASLPPTLYLQQQHSRAAHGGNTLFLASLAHKSGGTEAVDAELAAAASSAPVGVVNSRVTRMIPLPSVHPRLLVVGQEDGTLSMWHTMRRVCLGAVNLTTAAGVEDAGQAEDAEWGGGGGTTNSSQPATNLVMDVEETEGRVLVFGDGEGNVHLCRVRWSVVTDPSQQTAALAMLNPATFAASAAASPLSREQLSITDEAQAAASASSADDSIVGERSLPLLQDMERVHIFSSGLTLSSIRVVRADPAAPIARPSVSGAAATRPPSSISDRGATVVEAKADGSTRLASALQRARKERDKPRFLILCTGFDHYVRVFNLAGVPIGELGMDEWNAARPSSFRFMGERTAPPAVPLPCSLAGNTNWQRDSDVTVREKDCYHDYLADLSATLTAKAAVRVGSIRGFARSGSIASGPAARRAFGTTVLLDSPFSPPSRGATRMSATSRASRAVDAPLSPDHVSVSSAADKSPSNTAVNTLAFPDSADGLVEATQRIGTVPAAADSLLNQVPSHVAAQADPSVHTGRTLNMRLQHNTRHRYESDRRFRGVLKRSYARQLQNRYQESRRSHVLSPPPGHIPLPDLPGLFVSPTASSASSAHAPPGARADGAAAPRSPPVISRAASDSATTSSVWSNSALASRPRSSSGAASGAAESFLCALEQAGEAAVTSTEGAGEEEDGQSPPVSAFGRQGSSSTVGPGSLRDDPIARRRTSSVSTDVPHSGMGSPHGGAALFCTTPSVAVPPAMLMAPLLALDEPGSASPEKPVTSWGGSITKRPSFARRCAPLPAVHAQEQPFSSGELEERATARSGSFSSTTVAPAVRASSRRQSVSSMSSNTLACDGTVGRLTMSPDGLMASRRPSEADRQRAASMLSYLSTERARIVRNTQTPASRDQVSTLAVPVPTHPLSMGIAGGSASTASTPPSASQQRLSVSGHGAVPSTSTSLVDVYNHVDEVLERRRSKQLCRTSTSEEVASSAEGYLAQVTSRMYVAPVSQSSMSSLAPAPRSQRPSLRPLAHPELFQ